MRVSLFVVVVSGVLAVLLVSVVASSIMMQSQPQYIAQDLSSEDTRRDSDVRFVPSSGFDVLYRKEVGDFMTGKMTFQDWVRLWTGTGDSWVIVRIDDVVLLDNITYLTPPDSSCRVHAGSPPAVYIATVEDVIWGDKGLVGKKLRLISPFIRGDPGKGVVTYADSLLPMLPNMEYLIRVSQPIDKPTGSVYIACPTEDGYTDMRVKYTILEHEVRTVNLLDVFVIKGDRAYYILSPSLPDTITAYAGLRTQNTLTYTGSERTLSTGATVEEISGLIEEALNKP